MPVDVAGLTVPGRADKLNRATLNQVVDAAAAVLFLGMLATAFVLWFLLPPHTHRLYSLWGITRHQWGAIHAYLSFAFLGTVVLHLGLHWKWVVSVVWRRLQLGAATPRDVWQSGVALVLVLAGTLGIFWWAMSAGRTPLSDAELAELHPPSSVDDNATSANAPRETISVDLDFWRDVYPIFQDNCLGCHGPGAARGGFRVDSPDAFLASDGRPALIAPHDSDGSTLIAIVSGQKEIALPKAHRLPDAQVAVLRKWIDAGAVWPAR